jgi:hypothetical protein
MEDMSVLKTKVKEASLPTERQSVLGKPLLWLNFSEAQMKCALYPMQTITLSVLRTMEGKT